VLLIDNECVAPALEPSPRYSFRAPQSHPDFHAASFPSAASSSSSSSHKKHSHRTTMDKPADDAPAPSKLADRNGRLPKDRVGSADENSDYVETSDEADDTSSEEDAHDIRKGPAPRGRSKVKAEPSPGTSPARSPAPPGGWSGKRGPGPLPPGSPRVGGALSLFNELQEERACCPCL
jgi:hypothetical protein